MKKLFLFIFLLINFLIIFNPLNVSAHSNLLVVKYDDCIPKSTADGEDETWYYLCERNYSEGPIFDYFHIGQNISTIKYYFEDSDYAGNGYTWTTDIDQDLANNIKADFVKSMMKWNNVYYYSYDSKGNRIPNKVINIEEGTKDDHNLSIYPSDKTIGAPVAATNAMNYGENIETNNTNVSHRHVTDYYMKINIKYFYRNDSNQLVTDKEIEVLKERTGMHEVGHILGLDDVDVCCTKGGNSDHHNEILMGYGEFENRQDNVTYKDIAGVSIIREFHTDADHTWMKRTNDNGTIDLICAQCNGVLYDVSMDSNGSTYQGESINIYKDCIHHGGSNSNMLLVATDGKRDFFKCQNCRHIDTVEISEEYNLSNYSSTINKIVNLTGNETKYYKINSKFNKYYEFIVNGTYGVDIKLFDENFNEILVNDLNNSNSIEHIIKNLQLGTYYLELKNCNSSTNSASIKIISRTTAYLDFGNNDILLNTYNDVVDYYYFNDRGAGFYKFTIEGTKTDGTTISIPANTIKIYSESEKVNPMEKFTIAGFSNPTQNKSGEDSIITYLPRNGYFYLDIDISSLDLKSLNVIISSIESQDINLFDLSEETNSIVSVLNNSSKGDYIKDLNIEQAGKFIVSYNYSGNTDEDFVFILAKQNYNVQTSQYSLTTKIVQLINGTNSSFTYTGNLEAGKYYIGYLNKNDNSNVSANFERLVTLSGGEVLVTDPNYDTLCGSQISIIEKNENVKSYRETFITKNFTRVVYPNYNYGISPSRLDYNWYSSDESIAEVTPHGTVLGNNIGTVKIMAVLISDSSKVFVKEFTIINDTGTGQLVVNNKIEIKLSDIENEQFQLPLEEVICPFPRFQDYNWTLDNTCSGSAYNTSYNQWGVFTTDGTGCFTLIGRYQKNNRVTIIIHVVITN